MAKDRLTEVFDFVRRAFFPRWDKKNQWVIRELSSLPSEGRCDNDKKTIFVKYVPEEDDRLYELLIHEICHAVASPGHGKKFLVRMAKAATTAQMLGYGELSRMLNTDIEETKKGLIVDATEIYNLVGDWAVDKPDLTYDEMLEAVSRRFGFYPAELEKRYKRFRKVYEEAIRSVRDSRRIQEEFRQKYKI